MTMIKSYTDLEQSKKLAEILPIESADMHWCLRYFAPKSNIEEYEEFPSFGYSKEYLPCWSLAALLRVISDAILVGKRGLWHCYSYDGEDYISSKVTDNPIDTCYEMVLKLHELKMSFETVLNNNLMDLIKYD